MSSVPGILNYVVIYLQLSLFASDSMGKIQLCGMYSMVRILNGGMAGAVCTNVVMQAVRS